MGKIILFEIVTGTLRLFLDSKLHKLDTLFSLTYPRHGEP